MSDWMSIMVMRSLPAGLFLPQTCPLALTKSLDHSMFQIKKENLLFPYQIKNKQTNNQTQTKPTAKPPKQTKTPKQFWVSLKLWT